MEANFTLYSDARFWEIDTDRTSPSLFIRDHRPVSGSGGITVRIFTTIEQLRELRDALDAALSAAEVTS